MDLGSAAKGAPPPIKVHNSSRRNESSETTVIDLASRKGGAALSPDRDEGMARSFDALAMGLESNDMSRAKVLKLGGAALVASTLGLFASGDPTQAETVKAETVEPEDLRLRRCCIHIRRINIPLPLPLLLLTAQRRRHRRRGRTCAVCCRRRRRVACCGRHGCRCCRRGHCNEGRCTRRRH